MLPNNSLWEKNTFVVAPAENWFQGVWNVVITSWEFLFPESYNQEWIRLKRQKVIVIGVVSDNLTSDPRFGVKCLLNPAIHLRFVVHVVESGVTEVEVEVEVEVELEVEVEVEIVLTFPLASWGGKSRA